MELLEIVRQYYPKCIVKEIGTKNNPTHIEPRYFIRGNKGGSFSEGGIKNQIRSIKIGNIIKLLNDTIKAVKNFSIPAVSGRSEHLKAFIDEYIEAWEEGMGGDSSLYRKAKSL